MTDTAVPAITDTAVAVDLADLDVFERGEHLGDGRVERRQVQREAAAELLDARFVDGDEAFDGARCRRQRMRDVGRDRADRLDASERLAHDPREERRRGAVRAARAHGHRHQSRRAAVDKALPRIVGDQVLANQLVRSIRGLGRRQRVVADERRQRQRRVGAEHRDRAREHEALDCGAARTLPDRNLPFRRSDLCQRERLERGRYGAIGLATWRAAELRPSRSVSSCAGYGAC